MWTTDLGILTLARVKSQPTDGLLTYVRTEYGEAELAWYLAAARREAYKAGARVIPERPPKGQAATVGV